MPSRGGSEYAAHASAVPSTTAITSEPTPRRIVQRTTSQIPGAENASGTPARRPRARGTGGESRGARSGSRTRPRGRGAGSRGPSRPSPRGSTRDDRRPSTRRSSCSGRRRRVAGRRLRRDCRALGVEDGDRRGVDARVHRLADPRGSRTQLPGGPVGIRLWRRTSPSSTTRSRWRPPNSLSARTARNANDPGGGEASAGISSTSSARVRSVSVGRRRPAGARPRRAVPSCIQAPSTRSSMSRLTMPMKPGDVLGGGPLEVRLGRVELLERARPHDREPIAERERLDLVVGHVDGGELEAAVQLVDLRPHEVAEPRVEVGEGLVEEHDVGPRDEAAGERDALLLAARELRRVPVEEAAAVDERRDLLDPLGSPSLDRSRRVSERVADVLAHAHVRPERVRLEDHPDLALVGRHVDALRRVEDDAGRRTRCVPRRRSRAPRGSEGSSSCRTRSAPAGRGTRRARSRGRARRSRSSASCRRSAWRARGS